MTKTYKFSDIFSDKDNDGNTEMKLPSEVIKQLGLEEGDTVKIEVGDQGTLVISKISRNDN